MAGKILSFEIDEKDAGSFNNICEQIGVPMESLLRIFVKQVIRTNSVPFALSLDVRNENQKISADLVEILEANASSLAEVLKDENSHIVTFIISKMNYDDAARLLELLPKKMQEEIMLLLVNGMSMNAELFAAYVRYIKQKLEHSAAENYAFGSYEVSPETMLEKLNYPTKKRLLLALKNNDKKNYERISKNVFTFNDISRLTDRCVQKILREIDAMVLARALKGCETEVREKFCKNMSKLAWKMLEDEMRIMGKIPQIEADSAQEICMGTINRLKNADELFFESEDGVE